MQEKSVNNNLMMQRTLIVFIFVLLLISPQKSLSITPSDTIPELFKYRPKTSLGISLLGGICQSMIYTNDLYFNQKGLSSSTYINAGLGLILDIPIFKKSRFWINPEFMMIGINRPFASFNLTLQKPLSKSLFILGGASVAIDNFKYLGFGPSLGIAFKPAGRISLIIQNRLSYYKLPGSGEFVKYHAIQLPVSFVFRLDLTSTTRKVRVNTAAPLKASTNVKPNTSKPLEEPKVNPSINIKNEPVKTIEEPKVIPPENTKTEPVKPAAETKIIPSQNMDYSKYGDAELSEMLKKAVREDNSGEASKILYEINKRQSSADPKSVSYTDLTMQLKQAIQTEDYMKAQKIQDEINLRESSGAYGDIPMERLNIMLKDAIKVEDYIKADRIKEEINKRKK
jgi:protein-arginine kinase activator protein McsA